MKLLLFLLATIAIAFAQDNSSIDIVVLKDGQIIKWKIRRHSDTDSGKFRTVIPVFTGQ